MNRLSAILAAGLLAGCMGGEEKADVKVEHIRLKGVYA